MNSDEFYTHEDRSYIEPTLSSDEQKAFISNLRDIQGQNNAQIAQQTYNLGTQVPSNLGGLGGGEAYFSSRYQTPQVDEMVATLKSAANAQALQDVMSNYNAQLQNKYKQAYRNAQSRQRARQNAYYRSLTGGGTGSSSSNTSGWGGDISTSSNGASRKVYSSDPILNSYYNMVIDNYKKNGNQTPPKESDYQITADEYNRKLSEKTGLPIQIIDPTKLYLQ